MGGVRGALVVLSLDEVVALCVAVHGKPRPPERRYWNAERRKSYIRTFSGPALCLNCNARDALVTPPKVGACPECERLAETFREQVDNPPWKQRGRKHGPAQSSLLAGEVAWVMMLAGYRLSAKRTGDLAECLALALSRMGQNVSDLRDPAELALDAVRLVWRERLARFNTWCMALSSGEPWEAAIVAGMPIYGHEAFVAADAARESGCHIEATFALLRAFAAAAPLEDELTGYAVEQAAEARVQGIRVPGISFWP